MSLFFHKKNYHSVCAVEVIFDFVANPVHFQIHFHFGGLNIEMFVN